MGDVMMSGRSRLSLWLHIRTRVTVRGVSEWLFVQHIVGIPHTGHSSYLQITHPYITLSHNTLITDHTSQPFIPAQKVITIFTTNINCMHGIQCLLFSSHFLSNIDCNPESVWVSVAVVKIVTAAGSHWGNCYLVSLVNWCYLESGEHVTRLPLSGANVTNNRWTSQR